MSLPPVPAAPAKVGVGPQDLLYTLEQRPPLHTTLILGFQHCLTLVTTTVPIPFLLASLLCLGPAHPVRVYLISTIIFVSGLNTLLQATLGVRLPIVQGGNFAYLIPVIALLSGEYAPCEAQLSANLTAVDQEELWRDKIRVIQGSIAVSSLFQIFISATGLISVLLRWITPLTIVPTIMLVGLSLFDVAAAQASSHWGVSFMSIAIMIVFSQYLTDVGVPFPRGFKEKSWSLAFTWVKIFKLGSVILALAVSWFLCWLLTHLEVLSEGSPALTDLSLDLVRESPWIYVPYPGQWGVPRVAVAAVLGCMAASIASTVESIGDYFICARVSGAPPPPVHAVNRGILMEGVGVALAGLFGTGSGINSYSENIAALALTKVGSRRVVQASAVLMMVLASVCKFSALLATIPEPIIASLLFVLFSFIVTASLPMLLTLNIHSSRNLFILGFTVFFSLAVSKFVKANPEAVNTGLPMLDHMLVILLQTSMFLGSFIGCLLDNTIPGIFLVGSDGRPKASSRWGLMVGPARSGAGSDENRGLIQWRAQLAEGHASTEYDIPGTQAISRSVVCLQYIPFWPTFRGTPFSSNKLNQSSGPAQSGIQGA
ncbi:solute carrier family 23 member 1-like isoform X2 [Eriocheir sinensis]|nr:solute carrier family 23 member 1-like isoform X2 [Eriocheir sinensis]XP_050703183.1 solute carrier family 23 member 1-like isoform X2 [Eriocheir sinensis]XP_050703184.1 solute carrier family 23 member 1-like isoform X2 [Eriocheir sinensis]